MEIREPRYKVGDKVYCKKYESSAIITGVADYSFNKDKFFYNVEWECDGYLDEIHEDLLEPYIEKHKSVWNLKKRDKYYCLSEYCKISEFIWDDTPFDKNVLESGNGFLTKEEAEFEVERRKIETEMLRLGGTRKINELNSNVVYTIQMHFGLKYVYVRSFDIKQAPIGVIFFNYRKQAIKALETIGEERIKKYIFGVDE